MLFLQILNMDSIRQHLIDSIKTSQSISNMDLLNKVDSFYNNAWTKVAVLFGIVGIMVPIIINFVQFKKSEKQEEELNSSISEKIIEASNKIRTEIDAYFEEKLRIMQHASEGVSYSIQGRISLDKNKIEDAYKNYVTSMYCLFIGDDFLNFQNTKKEFLAECLIKFNKETYHKIDTSFSTYHDIDKLLTEIDNSEKDYYSNEVYEIREALKAFK
jgi:hypothetical protein